MHDVAVRTVKTNAMDKTRWSAYGLSGGSKVVFALFSTPR